MVWSESLKFPLPEPSSGRIAYWEIKCKDKPRTSALPYFHVHNLHAICEQNWCSSSERNRCKITLLLPYYQTTPYYTTISQQHPFSLFLLSRLYHTFSYSLSWVWFCAGWLRALVIQELILKSNHFSRWKVIRDVGFVCIKIVCFMHVF